MKKTLSLTLALTLLSTSTACLAKATEHDNVLSYSGPNSFSTVVNATLAKAEKQYGSLKAAAPHILIALDDDNTLTTMPQFLGGVAWFDWQETLIGSSDPQHVAKTFADLLQAQRLLFVMSKMALTDASIPVTLNKYAKDGIHMIVETARGPSFSDLTERQLIQNGIVDPSSNMLLFKQYGLKNPTYSSTTWSPALMCGSGKSAFTRAADYSNGALYLSGQDKGVGLECLQKTLGYVKASSTRQYTYIVFMDDLQTKVTQVMDEYQNNPNVDLEAIHFTKHDGRDVLPKDPAEAKKMKAEATTKYNNIYNAVNNNLYDADLPQK